MTINLQDISHADLRHMLGNRALNSATFAIDGTNTENVQTGATLNYTVKGIFYSKATVAEIDISGLTGLSSDALADLKTQMFGLEINAAGTISVVFGDQILTSEITAGDRDVDWPKASDDLNTLFAVVKVVNATGSAWTFGTTDLDASGVTDTYYNLSVSSF